MSLETVLIILVVGAIAGWLATIIVRGWGLGLAGNIVVGILGGLLGAWLLPKLGVSLGSGIGAAIASATIGAIVILVIIGGLQRIGFVGRRRL